MWADVVILSEPLADGDLCLFGRAKPFRIEHLMAQRSVEPLIVSVLPWRTWRYLDGLNSYLDEPLLQRSCDKF